MMARHLNAWCLFAALVAAVSTSSIACAAKGDRWPTVKELHETLTVVVPAQDGIDSHFLAVFKSTSGVPLYKFECHNGNYDDASEISFSGDFQCVLFELKGEAVTSGNLLAANTQDERSTDWWNRGRMRSAQLRSPCLVFPEYSTDRHFRLRGMVITLRFSGIEWSDRKDQQGNPLLGKFTFTLDVVPDSDMRGPVAALPDGPVPLQSCYP